MMLIVGSLFRSKSDYLVPPSRFIDDAPSATRQRISKDISSRVSWIPRVILETRRVSGPAHLPTRRGLCAHHRPSGDHLGRQKLLLRTITCRCVFVPGRFIEIRRKRRQRLSRPTRRVSVSQQIRVRCSSMGRLGCWWCCGTHLDAPAAERD